MRRAGDGTAEVQAKDGGDLDQDGCREGRRKWSIAGYILMTELTGFTKEQYVQSEEREASRIILIFRPEQLTEGREGNVG